MYFYCICGKEGDLRVLLFHHLLLVPKASMASLFKILFPYPILIPVLPSELALLCKYLLAYKSSYKICILCLSCIFNLYKRYIIIFVIFTKLVLLRFITLLYTHLIQLSDHCIVLHGVHLPIYLCTFPVMDTQVAVNSQQGKTPAVHILVHIALWTL